MLGFILKHQHLVTKANTVPFKQDYTLLLISTLSFMLPFFLHRLVVKRQSYITLQAIAQKLLT